MEDVFNKAVKIIAVSGVCAAAYLALFVLMVFAVAGGNQIIDKTPGFAPGSIPATINPMSQMAISYVVIMVNMSFSYLAVFIVGVWLFTTAYVLREDLARWGLTLKNGSKSFLHEVTKP